MSLRALGQRSKADELLTSALADAKGFQAERLAVEIASVQAAYWADDGRVEDGVAAAADAVTAAKRLGDPLLHVIARLQLARTLKHGDPKRAEKVLRELANEARDSDGLPYAEVYAELSGLLSQDGLAEEALKYSRKAYESERQKGGLAR